MFSKVLIANRGTVRAACIHAVKELGGKAVAFYLSYDNKSMGLRAADEVYRLATNQESRAYYDAEAITRLARETSSQAVHPGYGFLAENLEFAKALEQSQITLIAGDLRTGLEGMGDKLQQKKWAQDLGISSLPGSASCSSYEELLGASKSLSYPMVLKPFRGSGGAGINVINRESELRDAFSSLTRADRYQGRTKSAAYLEIFAAKARHIEVPVLRDSLGNVLVLPELDASVQRRYQRLIVETPAPFISSSMRQRLATMSRRYIETRDWVGLFTVEFLVVGDQEYFLEVNGYLPPSHMLTYHVCGVDLLHEQISIFSGHRLKSSQSEVAASGHCISVHLNAEDPRAAFQPSPGTLEYFGILPIPGLYCYSTAKNGDTLSTFYDSLIAQIISAGKTRKEALDRLSLGLEEGRVLGVQTNLAFLRKILNSAEFAQGSFDVSTLMEQRNVLALDSQELDEETANVAALVAAFALHNDPNSSEIIQAAEANAQASFWGFTSRWLNRNKMEF